MSDDQVEGLTRSEIEDCSAEVTADRQRADRVASRVIDRQVREIRALLDENEVNRRRIIARLDRVLRVAESLPSRGGCGTG